MGEQLAIRKKFSYCKTHELPDAQERLSRKHVLYMLRARCFWYLGLVDTSSRFRSNPLPERSGFCVFG